MKKIFLLFSLFLIVLNGKAQQADESKALQLVTKNYEAIGLNKEQLLNLRVSSTYFNETAGTQMVYLQQSYKSVPVYNQIWVLAFKADKLVSNAGGFITDMESATNHKNNAPSISAIQAVRTAFSQVQIKVPSNLLTYNTKDNGRWLDFGKPSNVTENVTAELMWVPIEKNGQKTVQLAWQIQVAPVARADWWMIQVDAFTGLVIAKINLTIFESFERKNHDYKSLLIAKQKNESIGNLKPNFTGTSLMAPPPSVTSADYRVIPLPIESPQYGSHALVHNPWELSGLVNNATTNGWHFDGTTNYNLTRGNNSFAYLDAAGSNAPNATTNWPDTSTSAIPTLTFTQTPNFAQNPSATNNKKFALNNLFYWTNLMHDLYYQYGFTEPAGNFQADNLGRGGNGADYVQAEAQDGSGTNNANFATPTDGSRPRMQMFIWDAKPNTTNVTVNAPATISGVYTAVESAFSNANLLADIGPVTAQVIYFNDAAGGTHEACTGAPTSSVTGKIALINRGNCNFTVKVLAAQAAGAVGVIVVNNAAGAPIIMGGGPDNTITCPAVMVSDVTGALIAAQLGAGVNATLNGGAKIDGDIDNGIVCHEFGHGISTRLTGGPNVSCLGNAEGGSEGWSDFVAYMITTNWTTALVTDGAIPRPMGLYALGDQNLFAASAPGTGIRHYRYCTDMALNPVTYASIGNGTITTEIHDVGEVWAEILWEVTWSLIQQDGINPNVFNSAGTGGNSVALKLVLEGMKLQPCSPGFVDSRNAILTADQNLYGGAHLCTLWAAFAKRGLGYSALQGSSNSASDQTPAFDLPPTPAFTAQPAAVTACAGTNASFSITATGYLPTYNWQVSTDGGATWANLSPAVTTATLTLTAVNAGMNNNQYRCQVKGGCPNTTVNSNPATLTVNTASPTITSQPANTSTCVGTNANFSITVSGSNTYNWQVSTDGGSTWNNLTPAVTSTTLSLTSVTAGMNNNQYRCQVTGGCPSTITNSTAAILTVTTGSINITSQPANAAACAGSNASFSITATGASLTYNWQVSTDAGATWNNLAPTVTTATLNLTGITAGMNNNQYRCVVNGPGACTAVGVVSNAATLSISSPIAITVQPTNASVCLGNDASFNITVTGANPAYNWQVSTDGGVTWNNVSPAVTTATLTVTSVTAGMNNNQYRCQVSGTCTVAAINSNAAVLSTNSPAIVTAQPANTAVCAGSNASFSITASGSGLTYNWQVSTDGGTTWNSLTPAITTATLALNAVTTAMNNNQYRCVVGIACSPTGVNSNAATLTVNTAPSITTQPSNVSICSGSDATFCVAATGLNVTYQWQTSATGCSGPWVTIAGATASCYTAAAVTASMNGTAYQCVVSGTCTPAVTTSCAVLTVNTAVSITTQPVNTTGCTGGTATFSITATGTGVVYNWQVSTDGGITWNNLSPAVTTATLTLSNVTAVMNNNQYRCQASGTCTVTPVNSAAATLGLSTTISFSIQPVSAGVCAGTNVSFTATAAGTGLAYNWQVSTDGGITWSNVSPVNNTNQLNIASPTVSMSGNQYRNVATGSCNPSGVNSNIATLTVNTSVSILQDPVNITGCSGTSAIFSATVTGSSISYQWQVSVAGGPFVNLTNSMPYSGVNTATLTINPATGLNGNRYRLNASGAPCGGIISSNSALLDVNPLPVVVLTASSYSNVTPYIRTTLYTTVSPAGSYSYQWFRDGSLVTSLTSDKFSVSVDDLGSYDVIVTDNVTGCTSNISNKASVDYALSGELFIYPNPSSGIFQVRYYSSTATARTLNVYDSKGARVYSKSYTISDPYSKMDVDMRNAASDVYLVELKDVGGKRIATGKVVIR